MSMLPYSYTFMCCRKPVIKVSRSALAFHCITGGGRALGHAVKCSWLTRCGGTCPHSWSAFTYTRRAKRRHKATSRGRIFGHVSLVELGRARTLSRWESDATSYICSSHARPRNTLCKRNHECVRKPSAAPCCVHLAPTLGDYIATHSWLVYRTTHNSKSRPYVRDDIAS